MSPFPLPFRPPLDEQCVRSNLCNPRSRNLAKISLILCLFLSIGTTKEPSIDLWISNWAKRPQIPNFPRFVDGNEKHYLTSIVPFSSGNRCESRPSLRRRHKNRRGLCLKEPRTIWRLGLFILHQCSSLFIRRIWGEPTQPGSLPVKELWGEISTPICYGYKKLQLLIFHRLYLYSLPLKNLKLHKSVCAWWWIDYKSNHWGRHILNTPISMRAYIGLTNKTFIFAKTNGRFLLERRILATIEKEKRSFKKALCSDIPFAKEQSFNDNPKDHEETQPTKVDKTFESSAPKKPKEAGLCGIKEDKSYCLSFILPKFDHNGKWEGKYDFTVMKTPPTYCQMGSVVLTYCKINLMMLVCVQVCNALMHKISMCAYYDMVHNLSTPGMNFSFFRSDTKALPGKLNTYYSEHMIIQLCGTKENWKHISCYTTADCWNKKQLQGLCTLTTCKMSWL